jgi:hypothetical protein
MHRYRFFVSAAALVLLSPVAAYSYDHGHGLFGGYPFCGSTPGCCERPVSKADHLWDNYCYEKWCPKVDNCCKLPFWHAAPAGGCCAAPACDTACGGVSAAKATPASGSKMARRPWRP